MNYSLEIDSIRKTLSKQRFVNELEYLKEKGDTEEIVDEDNWIIERVENLDKIITSIEGSMKEVKKDEYKEMLDEIDRCIYKKRWHQIPEFHKMKKIKEYIFENIDDEATQKKIIDDMNELIYHKKLNGKKFVVYDQTSEKILSIPALNYDKESGEYTIKTK